MEAGYVGTHGLKLFYNDQLNQFKIYDSGFLAAFKDLAPTAPTPRQQRPREGVRLSGETASRIEPPVSTTAR